MASFAVKAEYFISDASGNIVFSVPSIPIYSIYNFGVNVPDTLVVLALMCCTLLWLQPLDHEVDMSHVDAKWRRQECDTKIDILQGLPEEAPKQVEATIKEDQWVKEDERGPRSFIGQRVAVEKKSEILLGTVEKYDSETRCWLIRYDNGEEDELNRLDLASAFKEHSKHLSDYLKAMWRSGEI